MGKLNIDWKEVFCRSSSPDREDAICLGYPSPAPATRAGLTAAKRARAEGVASASSDDEHPRPSQALRLRLVRHAAVGERRPGVQVDGGPRSPVTGAAAKAVADRGLDACSAAENVLDLNQEDEHGECGACKYCSKPSPVLVTRKRNHEQADGDGKRVARPAAKNDGKEPAPPAEIFEALREIPGLDRADLLRAYSTLIRDDRQFRSRWREERWNARIDL